MSRIYKTADDVINHMEELIRSQRPYMGISRNGTSECIVVPLESGDAMKAAMIQYGDKQKTPGHGAIVEIEWLDFQETEWTPIDLPETEWKQYLPEEKQQP